MKKTLSILLLLVSMLFLLTGCYFGESGDEPITVTLNGQVYTVDPVEHFVLHDGTVYPYVTEGNVVTVTYPDGSTYWRTYVDEGSYTHDHSADYDPEKGGYADGAALLTAVYQSGRENNMFNNSAFAFIFFALGLFYVLAPREAWRFGHLVFSKEEEPSRAAIVLGRIAGVIAICVALWLLLFHF